MRKIAGYLTKNRSGKDQKIAQSTHENEYIKPRKTFWRNSKQFLSISSLKIYVLRLEIYISSLKTEFLKASKLLLFGARLLLCFIRQCRYVADIHNILYECPHVPKLAKFKPPRCPIGVYWNTLCLMRDVWTIKTYMI